MTAAEQVVARGNQRAPLNLALVIDDSGSMRGPTLEQAKESARLIIEALDNKDVLSIVTFENKVRTLMLGEEMTAAGKGRAMEQIAAIRARGGTALGGGWLAGLDAVLKSQLRMDGAMNRILLLTDGGGNVGNCEPGFLGEQSANALKQGVYTSAVGIGEGYLQEQIDALASNGGGMLHDAQHPHEIVEVVMGEFGDLGRIWAEDIRVRVSLPSQAVDCSLLGTMPSGLVSTDAGLVFEVSAGVLLSGATREIVLRLDFQNAREGMSFDLPVDVYYRLRGDEAALSPDLDRTHRKVALGTQFVVQNARFDFSAERDVDSEFAHSVADAWLAWLSRKMTAYNRAGDFETAQVMLRYERKALLKWVRAFDDEREYRKKLNAIRVLARHRVDERMRKEVHLLASKMSKGESDYRSYERQDIYSQISDEYGEQ
jgi:Ca-activated chloride channel family protein